MKVYTLEKGKRVIDLLDENDLQRDSSIRVLVY